MISSDGGVEVSRVEEMRIALTATLPFIVGAVPFAIVFGVVASGAGLSTGQTMAMSLFVFSGSAQVIAIPLIAAGTQAWAIWLATFILNVRHTLYAATLVSRVRHLPVGWRFVLSAFLTDETFAVMEARYRDPCVGRHAHWGFLASCAAMYVNWNFWTMLAAIAGQRLHGLAGSGLEFAVIAAFIGMVAPRLRERPAAVAAGVASLIAILAAGLPYKLNLTLAAVLGVAAATAVTYGKNKRPIV